MILKNPTENDIAITYKGAEYSVSAMGEVSVPEVVGAHWKKIHSFLIESEDVEVNTRDKDEKKEETTLDEIINDIVTEEVKEVKKEKKEVKEKVTRTRKNK